MNRKISILTATVGLLAFTGCSTIRQYDLAPHGNESTPTEQVVNFDACPAGQDCLPVGEPTTTTGAPTTTNEPPCEDGQPVGTCNYPVGYRPPVTVPDTTPVVVCGGNVTGECS